jgi:hypothetical protein
LEGYESMGYTSDVAFGYDLGGLSRIVLFDTLLRFDVTRP